MAEIVGIDSICPGTARAGTNADNFQIGTPAKNDDDDMGMEEDELEEGPNTVSERRIKSPERKPAVKRKVGVHEMESGTKMIIRDDGDDEMGTQSAKVEADVDLGALLAHDQKHAV